MSFIRNTNTTGKIKEDSVAKKVRRTGEKTFVVEHDDGSKFECKSDNPELIRRAESSTAIGSGLIFSGIGEKRPLVCDVCKEVVHRITVSNGKSICVKCK
ncbi:MAG: hypothetical protein E2O29_02055 [Deltaproteobacteria bacterium]|nr:MAG: hypothetical protein E2O29_02055 [Deltaproteobacteria bacterium]